MSLERVRVLHVRMEPQVTPAAGRLVDSVHLLPCEMLVCELTE